MNSFGNIVHSQNCTETLAAIAASGESKAESGIPQKSIDF
jgi:hypothetical protein